MFKNKTIFIFLLIGTFNTLLDTGIFTTLINIFGKNTQNILLFNVISFSTTIISAYTLNGKITFKDDNLTLRKFVKYYISNIFGMFLNTIITYTMINILIFGMVTSKIIAACVVVIYNFTISKNYIFKRREQT